MITGCTRLWHCYQFRFSHSEFFITCYIIEMKMSAVIHQKNEKTINCKKNEKEKEIINGKKNARAHEIESLCGLFFFHFVLSQWNEYMQWRFVIQKKNVFQMMKKKKWMNILCSIYVHSVWLAGWLLCLQFFFLVVVLFSLFLSSSSSSSSLCVLSIQFSQWFTIPLHSSINNIFVFVFNSTRKHNNWI